MSDDNALLEIVYVTDDSENEIPLLFLDYHELHAITESLKLTDRWISSKMLRGEDWGWDNGESPINKVSRTSLREAQDKTHWMRRYMASRFQGVPAEQIPSWEEEMERKDNS